MASGAQVPADGPVDPDAHARVDAIQKEYNFSHAAIFHTETGTKLAGTLHFESNISEDDITRLVAKLNGTQEKKDVTFVFAGKPQKWCFVSPTDRSSLMMDLNVEDESPIKVCAALFKDPQRPWVLVAQQNDPKFSHLQKRVEEAVEEKTRITNSGS